MRVHLRRWLVTVVTMVLVPTAIVIASRLLAAANESAGWLRYRLPVVFLWIFLASGVAAPMMGIGSLIWIWSRRREHALPARHDERSWRMALALASLTALLAPMAWVNAFGEVFFAAGGSR